MTASTKPSGKAHNTFILAGPYERGKTEDARERFLDMQTAIAAMNRAIEDEERSQGSVHAP
jgi:hypothetical protein